MEYLLCLLLLCSSNADNDYDIVDIVDCVELNHCYHPDTVLDQLLFYKMGKDGYELIDYRVIRHGREELTEEEFRVKERKFHESFLARRPHYRGKLPRYYPDYVLTPMHPIKNHSTQLYYMLWREGYIWRKVIAKSFTETWTDYDPEIMREQLMHKRKGLSKGFRERDQIHECELFIEGVMK